MVDEIVLTAGQFAWCPTLNETPERKAIYILSLSLSPPPYEFNAGSNT